MSFNKNVANPSVAEWMSTVDLFLEDEGQQYGNMEEAASVARTPARHCNALSCLSRRHSSMEAAAITGS